MTEMISVLIVNQSISQPGLLTNAAFVLGLTAGRLLPSSTFGTDVMDGDKSKHKYLTNIGHHVRKASSGKLRKLRTELIANQNIIVIDYTEDAAPSDYLAYEQSLGTHSGDQIDYRALYIYGSAAVIVPLTKNLSRL